MARTGLAVGGAVLLLVGGSVLAWGNVGGSDSDGRSDSVRHAQVTPISDVTRVEISSGSGNVQIRHDPGAPAGVRQHENRGLTDWLPWNWGGEEPEAPQTDNGVLRLNTDCGWNCSVDYVVNLPNSVPVEGELGSGELSVDGMSSVNADVSSGSVQLHRIDKTIRAHSGSGDIDLVDVGGNVDVDTSSGEIDGRGLRGAELRARTGSGNLQLTMASPQFVDAETGSGEVELTVPPGPYRVNTSTGSGNEQIDVARDQNAQRRLNLSTGSGDLEVRSGESG